MTTQTLIHTSPCIIKEIKSDAEPFGSVLFFSDREYVMTSARTHYVYHLELQEDEIIDVGQFYYCDSYKKLADVEEELQQFSFFSHDVCFDVETCQGLLDSSLDTGSDIFSEEELYSSGFGDKLGCIGWEIQKLQAKCAQALGYVAAESIDEQGTVYAVDMLHLANKLIYKGARS